MELIKCNYSGVTSLGHSLHYIIIVTAGVHEKMGAVFP